MSEEAVIERCEKHQPKPNGECATCGAHRDLPTLPMAVVQTAGGYKAIHDAEDRHVAFIGMRDDDGLWGAFLTARANSHDALRSALQYVSEVSERQAATDADDSDTVSITVTVGWLREVKDALALVDGSATEEGE